MNQTIRAICCFAMVSYTASAFAFVTVNDETESAATKLGAQKITEFQHKEGQSALSVDEQNELKKVIRDAKTAGKIVEVKILSWADREYPASGQVASSGDIKLAEARADHLKKYVKNQFGVNTVNTYNMAKRPNAMQELFDTTQSKVKGSLEATGAAPTTQSETGFMGFKGKASESLVLVFVK